MYITPLRTKRLSVDMRELTIDAAEMLCDMPVEREQAGTTALLRAIMVPQDRPLPGQVSDPRLWSVQERMFVMSHYLAHTIEAGNPNFSVGDGNYSDYILDGTDFIDVVHLGNVGGNEVVMRPLLGFQAEAIEDLVLSGVLRENRLSWWVCAMACQIHQPDEAPPMNLSDADYREYVLARALDLRQATESEFEGAIRAFLAGTKQLDHFFSLIFTNTALAAEPVAGGPDLHPARFPVRSAIRTSTLQILGIADQNESGPGDALQPDSDSSGADDAERSETVL